MEKEEIIKLINKANTLTPEKLEKKLNPIKGFPNVPDWHEYERDIWTIGEEIRQIINSKKTLRKDQEINDLIMEFCLNKNSKRGRQPFVLLMGYKNLSEYAPKLIRMINDKSISGQIIDTLYKMQAKGYEKEIEPFTRNKTTWIRKIAIKYIEKYGTQHYI